MSMDIIIPFTHEKEVAKGIFEERRRLKARYFEL